MSNEESPKKSRFRRTSRFRKSKGPPNLTDVQPQEDDIPETGSGLQAASAPEEEPPSQAAAPQFTPVAQQAPQFQPAAIEPGIEVQPQAAVASLNALTVDVKEWFQTMACSEVIKFSHWGKYERRVERGIHLILALLRQYDAKATFFILGIVAREFPQMVKLIKQEGHEIGVCGYYNRPLYSIPPEEYINEIEMSMSLLKGLTGSDINVHRAPGWSVTPQTLWLMDVLKTYRLKYDSSIYPVRAPLYGVENAPSVPYTIEPQGIVEFPPTTYRFVGQNIALFGGTYLRILPYTLISMGLESINNQGNPVMVHISPWEMEGEFPKVDLGWEGYMAQYAGVKTAFSKISRLVSSYKFDTISNVLEKHPPMESVNINLLKNR